MYTAVRLGGTSGTAHRRWGGKGQTSISNHSCISMASVELQVPMQARQQLGGCIPELRHSSRRIQQGAATLNEANQVRVSLVLL